ncbi:uncharacterized protein [Spinacia oleracea]|uniref:Retrotransposon gag domain-containing protein n=1 Tax=Spinacia oleracea TaxID=3562 RepID=A0ABM3RHB2_SPIOL|nr:uncharacterized protein LOC130469630 [Spinacia oleracea]
MANQGITDVVKQLAEVVQNLAQARNNPGLDPAGEMLKKVAQSNPPLYQMEIDPIVLENWLREFDKLIRCENTWRATPKFGWESFKVSLRNKFYPLYLKRQKAQKFIEMRMEGMSVTEYYSKFIELSRFAPEVVATKGSKIREWIDYGFTDEASWRDLHLFRHLVHTEKMPISIDCS